MSIKVPWIGESRGEWTNGLCGFAPNLGDVSCNRDATTHGLKFDDEGELLTLNSCDEHARILSLLCDYVHPFVHPCGIEGSLFRWPENECFLDWDAEAEFPVLARTPEMTA